ncbi:sister chromatid cohesion 1 protein 1 [Melia azedarach]|uniref:Sister chromatid cohesion 1 protein 1 n=1 Tax=Melia azedarach TaxID=155640 RepID=A0ACC1YTR4_MELAZ|nr:sister chromatid cohesion 1 protein 1 [Melia azedarach]
MAATMHAKINRKKLNKLNIIKICEEILNPSVPMALRLSGILMGGVVIVYERKVKLFYDDVNRFLAEVNEAWKVKASPDPTVLPKGKSQAKRETITLPENKEMDVEQSLNYSNATTMEFQHTAYFAMRLDNVDDSFIHKDFVEEDPSQNFHQADAENITLFERFDMYQANDDMYNRFERFDIDEEGETQPNFTSGDHSQIPTFIPSPPPQDEPQRAEEIHEQHPEQQVNQRSGESKEARQDQQRQGPLKRKTRRLRAPIMDYEQTMIPGHLYQSWLQDASDISSRRRKRKKANTNLLSTMKIGNLMEIPPVVLTDDFFTKGNGEIHYPAPLLKLWMKSTQPPHDSPFARTSPPQPPEPSFSSPLRYDICSGVRSRSLGVSIEKLRENVVNNDKTTEDLMEEIRANFINNGFKGNDANGMVTPGNSADDVRSIPSSASGHGILSFSSEINSGRSNQKRPRSSSRHSSSSLEPVAEENPLQYPDPNFKLSRLSEKGSTPDPELLCETGPTPTQIPIINAPLDKITDSIRTQMKAHFETPGGPKVESLNRLTAGMNRKSAAMLFYQTCVLASTDDIRVEQKVPFGDILISRGAKM